MRRSFLFILLAMLPVNAMAQSTLNFPRGFSPADLGATGFAVVNPGASAAPVTFTLYSATGSVVSTSNQSIPARGQLALLGTQLFSTTGAGGWVQATSATTGLQGFWLGGDFATFTDGAEAAAPASDLIFPLVAGQTEINVANPTATPFTVQFRIFAADGSELAPAVIQPLLPRGFIQSQVAALFPAAAIAQATHVRATCTMPFVGTSLVTNYLVSPATAVVNAVDAAGTVTQANFPHVISGALGAGSNYTTVVGATNLSALVQSVSITFTPASGAAPTTVQRTIPGNGALRETAQSLFSLGSGFQDGWVRVAGSAPLTGYVAYGESVSGGLAVVPVQAAARSSLLFAHIADLNPWFTGLALLNTSTTNADVEVFAMSPDGSLIGGAANVPTARFTLNAGQKQARLLSELIPQTQQRMGDGGFVFVRTANGVPLFGIELFFTRSQTVLSNVAAGALATGITYTPPSPSTPVSLSGVSPSRAVRGATVTLTGTGFDTIAGNNVVEFSAVSGTVDAAATGGSGTSVTVAVPATAITGPVRVRRGTATTAALILEVVATATTVVQSAVAVGAGQTVASADIYVAPPAGTLNVLSIGLCDTQGACPFAPTAIELPRGGTRTIAVVGSGISAAAGSTVTLTGPGLTVSNPRFGGSGTNAFMTVDVAVDPSAALGPRSVLVTNSNLDVSVMSGGVIIR